MLRKLILAAGCSTPAGIAGQVRPRRRCRGGSRQPHGKRASCSGNQLLLSPSTISNKLYEKSLSQKLYQ
ncbi:hypothetical protein F0342_20055 [Bacillus sp. CH30_1T]|nr:hypothetical protein F0342_20055 [Bacillus sp. CH30_1T]